MFSITPEGQKQTPGFNFYPLSEWRSSIGFRYHTTRRGTIFLARYSTKLKKLILIKV